MQEETKKIQEETKREDLEPFLFKFYPVPGNKFIVECKEDEIRISTNGVLWDRFVSPGVHDLKYLHSVIKAWQYELEKMEAENGKTED